MLAYFLVRLPRSRCRGPRHRQSHRSRTSALGPHPGCGGSGEARGHRGDDRGGRLGGQRRVRRADRRLAGLGARLAAPARPARSPQGRDLRDRSGLRDRLRHAHRRRDLRARGARARLIDVRRALSVLRGWHRRLSRGEPARRSVLSPHTAGTASPYRARLRRNGTSRGCLRIGRAPPHRGAALGARSGPPSSGHRAGWSRLAAVGFSRSAHGSARIGTSGWVWRRWKRRCEAKRFHRKQRS